MGWLQRPNNWVAIMLLLLMFLTNPAFIGPLHAARADAEATADGAEQADLKIKTEAPAGALPTADPDSSHLADNEKARMFFNRLIPYYIKQGKRQGPEWLKTTDIKFSFTQDNKPVYSLETVQPFAQADSRGQLWFWQGRYAHQGDGDNTANLGVGWRKLAPDKTRMVGLNMFYDHGFKYDLSRVGFGAEYFNKLAEYRANVYIPTSGDRQTGVSYWDEGVLYSYIRAVQGFDYEVGTSLKHARWLSFYASGFYYDQKYNPDEEGFRLRSVMQLTPRFSAELGYEKSNLSRGSIYAHVAYKLADCLGPSLYGDSGKKDKRNDDLTYKLLQKVERNNTIKTETFTKFVSYNGSVSANVTNAAGQPVQGASLQAYQNGSPAGNPVLTDTAGTGVISGLNVGTYTVKATYFRYSGDSSAVTVQKGQTADTAIRLPFTGGSIKVNVVDSQGNPVSGAAVTAHPVGGGQSAQAERTIWDRILGVKTAFASEGEFTFTITTGPDGTGTFNLPPGSYSFTVNANAQTMNSINVNVPASGGTVNVVVALNSGNNSNAGTAAVTVTDGSGPLSGATVSVTVNGTARTATTNGSGLAVFSDLPPGTYAFSASKSGYTGNTATILTIGVSASVSGTIALTIQPGNADITVTDGTNPLSGATVSVTVNGTAQTASTNSAGVASFTNIPTGTYAFTAAMAGYTSNTAANVAITNGATASAAISLTRQTGNASITVTDGTNPLSGATVSVTVNGTAQTASTNSAGVASFTNIPTGTYAFTAAMAGYASNTAANVAITNGATATAAISLTRQTGNASITVTDGANPLSGATVSVTVNGSVQTATTNGSGVASFANIPSGTYTFTASKSEYNDNTVSVTITSGGTAAAAVALARQTGNVNITVTDGANPLSSVTVSVTVNGSLQTATTNGSGVANFSNIPTGTYTFTASKSGYNSNTASVAVASGSPAAATVALTRQTGNVTVTLSGTMSASNYTVTVTDSASATHTGTVSSGSTTATISNIPVGNCTVTVSAPSGYTAIPNPNSFTLTTAGQAVAVTSSQQTGNVTVTLSGTMSASNYTVTVTDSASATHTGTVSSGSTTATISNIPVGNCTVTVSAPSGYTAIPNPNSFTLTTAGQAVAVTSSQQTGNVTITLSGTMSASNYTVTVTDSASGTHTGTVNSGSTTATISNIPVGDCTVTVTPPSGYSANPSPNSFTLTTAGKAVAVTSSLQTASVTITLSGTMSASNYTVTVTDSASGTHTGTVSSGSTTATISNIPVGNCTVAVTPPSGYTATPTPSSFTLSTAGQAVAVTSSQQTGNVTVTLSGTMSASNYTVTVTDSASATHIGTVNSGSTTATISNIPVGDCTVTVTPPSGYTATPTPSSFTLSTAGQAVAVTSSQQTGNVTITLGGTMSVSGYTVTVTDSAGGTHSVSGPQTLGASATISNIPVGNCIVTVSAPSGYTATLSLSNFNLSTAGQTVIITFDASGSTINFTIDPSVFPTNNGSRWTIVAFPASGGSITDDSIVKQVEVTNAYSASMSIAPGTYQFWLFEWSGTPPPVGGSAGTSYLSYGTDYSDHTVPGTTSILF
ncbi:carboxypeptidase regulatory-like domain-containing protein [Methylomusa anaerophila]|uniref:Putative invasin n=1 Tax=Methylomusa anaerophila TaxID=1930071 RepID=A0A348AH28_9FIRM|nr:carboxypeptidase regulatory-like domain-containing protein [Methylomusa anaerophila]BBB90376.1 putative invasin [Methylomusa anaerophila]